MDHFTIRWKNFRSLADSGWLDVKPLTVVVGPNNSGKTSVLAPLLLLKQSIDSTDAEQALVLKGDYVHLGSYTDMAFGHDPTRQLTLGLRWDWRDPTEELRPVGTYPPGGVDLAFCPGDRPNSIVLRSYEAIDVYGRRYLRRRRRQAGTYSLESMPSAARSSRGEDIEARRAIRNSQPDGFLFGSDEVIAAAFDSQLTASSDETPSVLFSPFTTHYVGVVTAVTNNIQGLLDRIYYVGPLREPPHRLYELSGTTPSNVGVRGQYAPDILFRWRNTDKLGEVNRWLAHFGFDGRVVTNSLGGDAFAICFQAGDAGTKEPNTDIADTGFGMSQVLPLIVQGLDAPADSLIVAEQPEIHLNPRLQSTLADLFVSWVSQGLGALIETHSEHLLLRLRTLVAKGAISAADIAIYYVEKDGRESRVRPVRIHHNGHIDDWPAGFFEDSLHQAFELAAEQSRGAR